MYLYSRVVSCPTVVPIFFVRREKEKRRFLFSVNYGHTNIFVCRSSYPYEKFMKELKKSCAGHKTQKPLLEVISSHRFLSIKDVNFVSCEFNRYMEETLNDSRSDERTKIHFQQKKPTHFIVFFIWNYSIIFAWVVDGLVKLALNA